MTDTNEPTRDQIVKRIAQLEWLLLHNEPAVGWKMDLAVYRMALRTRDAEEAAKHWKKLRKGAEVDRAAMAARAEKAEQRLAAHQPPLQGAGNGRGGQRE